MAITPRWGGLRPEPYNPNAVDADNDGIVQEGTAFERPAGTRLLDSLGNELADGLSTTDRDTSWFVVDSSGRAVQYTPSYGGALGPARPRTIDQLQGTLEARTGTIGDRVGTIEGSAQTLEQITGTITSPPAMPEAPAKQEIQQLTGSISKKNQDVIDSLISSGGTWDEITDEFISNNSEANRYAGLFSLRTKSEKKEIRERRTKRLLSDLRQMLNGESIEPDSSRSRDEVSEFNLESISDEVKDLILQSTDEELIQIIEDRAIKFHQTIDKRTRVRVPAARVSQVLDSGYKTTHEVQSQHSSKDIRSGYEKLLGIPTSAGASVRPASGYMQHPDWEEFYKDSLAEEIGRPITEFSDVLGDMSGPAGSVSIYGNVEFILKPEVSGRVKYGRGDSLNTQLVPTRIEETDTDLIANAIMSNDGKEYTALWATAVGLLQSHKDGNFKKSNRTIKYNNGAPEGRGVSDYYEALIFGSFDAGDVEEVRASLSSLDQIAMAAMDAEIADLDPLGDIRLQREKHLNRKLKQEFLSDEFINSLGLDAQELDHLRELIDAESMKQVPNYDARYQGIPDPISKALKGNGRISFVEHRNASNAKKEIESRGIKVTALHESGRDVFDISSFGDAGDLATPEEVLMRRVRETIATLTRESLRAKTRPQGISSGASAV